VERHGFLYSPELGPSAWDFHEMMSGQIAPLIARESLDGSDDGSQWYLGSLSKINQHGDAVGFLGKKGVSGWEKGRACVIYGATTLKPLLALLPDRPTPNSDTIWQYTNGISINDSGLIMVEFLGINATGAPYEGAYLIRPYFQESEHSQEPELIMPVPIDLQVELHVDRRPRLNNSGQVGGQLATGEIFIYSLGDRTPLKTYPEFNLFSPAETMFWDMNDYGTICGRRVVKGFLHFWRYDGTLLSMRGLGATHINNAGDMNIRVGTYSSPLLYHQGTGLIDLEKLIIGKASDLNCWKASIRRDVAGMTQRGAWNTDPAVVNYPGFAGTISGASSGNWVYLLRPVKP
jgi:hypothetical protein